jgi:hypothetical protein
VLPDVDPKFETLRNRDNRNEQRFGWGLSYLSRKLLSRKLLGITSG